jgi:AcrR family transcriptional regulator
MSRGGGAVSAVERTDARILDAALAEASVVGLDGLTMLGVARRAGLTTGALYPRYEDVTELQVHLWQERSGPAIAAFVDAAVAEARSGPLVATAATIAAMDPLLLIGIEHLVVGARDPAVREVVGASITGWLARMGVDPGLEDPRSVTLVVAAALTLGAAATGLSGAVPRVDWAVGLSLCLTAGLSASATDVEADLAGPRPSAADIAHIVDWSGDPVQDAFLRAALEVIAEVGYHRTTVARLARHTTYSTQAVYLRHPTKADLFVDVIDRAVFPTMAAIGDANLRAFESDDPVADLAAVATRHLAPEWESWRRLRLETQVAARHVEPIAAAFRLESEGSDRDWSQDTHALLGEAPALLRALPWVTRALSVGAYLLHPYLPALSTCDWRIAAGNTMRGLAAAARQQAGRVEG